jgi:DNA-binding FrmR family transcriptional regulator
LELLDGHVTHCVSGAIRSGNKKEAAAKTEELLEAVRHFAKTR